MLCFSSSMILALCKGSSAWEPSPREKTSLSFPKTTIPRNFSSEKPFLMSHIGTAGYQVGTGSYGLWKVGAAGLSAIFLAACASCPS